MQLIATSSQTSVDIVFRGLTTVPLPSGDSDPVVELRVYADEPDALVAATSAYLPVRAPATG